MTWTDRFFAVGLIDTTMGDANGLKSRRSPGRTPFLTDSQRAELLDLVHGEPDPRLHGVLRCRCMGLRAEVARRFRIEA